MKTSLLLLIALAAFSIHAGLAADKDKPDRSTPTSNPYVVRLRFVPGSAPKKGASWTALGQSPEKGVLWLQAHAGIGDRFPVANKEGVKLFEVFLAEGDDDHLVLEILESGITQKISLLRDKIGSVEVAGIKYEFLYPSIEVDAAGNKNPTTNEAMIIVTRRL